MFSIQTVSCPVSNPYTPETIRFFKISAQLYSNYTVFYYNYYLFTKQSFKKKIVRLLLVGDVLKRKSENAL